MNTTTFRGLCVATKRQSKRFVRYFSDKPKGRDAAFRAARKYRDELAARLPWPTKVKRKYVRNTTGVIGVARVKQRTGAGKIMLRYVASWPRRIGKPGRAIFAIGLYGEAEAFRLAVRARRAGLRELMD
jgi:hypothetical protein